MFLSRLSSVSKKLLIGSLGMTNMASKKELPEKDTEWCDVHNKRFTVIAIANDRPDAPSQPIMAVCSNTDVGVITVPLTHWLSNMTLCGVKAVPEITFPAQKRFAVELLPKCDIKALNAIKGLTIKLWKMGVPITEANWDYGTLLSDGWDRNTIVSTTINFQRNFGYITGEEAKAVHKTLTKWLDVPIDREDYKIFGDFDVLILKATHDRRVEASGYKEGKLLFVLERSI
jgi:hypothetical protein